MKLLLVEPLAHTPGYFEEYVRCLSGPLAARGIDISLVSFDGLVDSQGLVAGVRHISFVEAAGRRGRVCRLLPRLIPLRPIRQVADEIQATACTLEMARRVCRRESFDVIHVPGVAVPEVFYPLFALLQRRKNIVYGLWVHSREEDVRGWGAKFGSAVLHLELARCLRLLAALVLGGRPGIALTNRLYRRAMRRNRLTFLSDSPSITATYARAPFRDRIFTIPLAVYSPSAAPVSREEARRRLQLADGHLVLLHFGTNHAYKDFRTIFAAAAGLDLDCRLVFAGKVLPQYRENNPRRLARRYRLAGRTTVDDRYIAEDEVPLYFCAADAVILSHLKGFASVSGVLYVAAQYGVPAITADAGDDGDLVRRWGLGLTYRPEDPESLRQAMLRFSSLTPQERQEMAGSIARFVEENSWENAAAAHVRLYEASLRGDDAQGAV